MDRFQNFNDRLSTKQKRKKYFNKRLLIVAAVCCLIAVAVFFCFGNNVNPFSSDELSHPQVEDHRSKAEARADFDQFLHQTFINEVTSDSISLNFTVKNQKKYGIPKMEPTLGEYTTKAMHEGNLQTENQLAALHTFSYEKLTKEQKLLYDILQTIYQTNLQSEGLTYYAEALGPTSGIQAQLPVLLAEYNFYSKEDVNNYLKILEMVPTYFAQICEFEKKKSRKGLFMSDTTAEAIIDQCQEFIEDPQNNYLIAVFDNKLKIVSGVTEKEKNNYQKKNKEAILKKVIPAYQEIIATLKVLKGTGKNEEGLCHFKDGSEYYAYLIKSKTGSSRSIREIRKMLEGAISTSQKKMASIMTDSPEDYYDAQKVNYKYKEPVKTVNYLKKAINKDFPALSSNIKCQIKYVDESLEEHLSPAFYLTPPIDDYKNNDVYINQNEKYDLSKAFTTIAHESYPGHLYQTCYFASECPNPLREVINISGYTEGWGTYAELYSYHLSGLRKNVAEILEANTLATLCVYARADMEINYYGWDYNRTNKYLKNYGFNETQAKTIYDSLIAEPVGYLQYALGYLEIEELLNEAKEDLGNQFSLKEFHKFYLSIGPAPFVVIRDRFKEWVKGQQKGR